MANPKLIPFELRGKSLEGENKHHAFNQILKSAKLEYSGQLYRAERFEKLELEIYTNDPKHTVTVVQLVLLDGDIITQPKEGYILHIAYPEPIELKDEFTGFTLLEGDATYIIRALTYAVPILSLS